MQPEGSACMHACMNGPVFLFLKGGGGWGEPFLAFFPLVPNVFPTGSHQVPKEFSSSECVPNSTLVFPRWFAQSSSPMHIS